MNDKKPPAYVLAFPPAKALDDAEPVDLRELSKWKWTGSIALEIEVLTPLFTGSGSFEPDAAGSGLVRAPLRRAGLPCIAGSSIKGACRQVVELLTQSAGPFESGNQRSRAGVLFGSAGRRGPFSFDDAVPLEPFRLESLKVRVPHEPKLAAGRRFYRPHSQVGPEELPKEPATLPSAALGVGTRLETVLRFTEVGVQDIGLVLLGLGINHFSPRLGGAKYDDFGRVRYGAREIRQRLGFGREQITQQPGARPLAAAWIDEAEKELPPDGKAALGELKKHFGARR